MCHAKFVYVDEYMCICMLTYVMKVCTRFACLLCAISTYMCHANFVYVDEHMCICMLTYVMKVCIRFV